MLYAIGMHRNKPRYALPYWHIMFLRAMSRVQENPFFKKPSPPGCFGFNGFWFLCFFLQRAEMTTPDLQIPSVDQPVEMTASAGDMESAGTPDLQIPSVDQPVEMTASAGDMESGTPDLQVPVELSVDNSSVDMAATSTSDCLLFHVVSGGNMQVYSIMANVVHADGTVEYTLPVSTDTGMVAYDNNFTTTQGADNISQHSLEDLVSLEAGVPVALDAVEHDISDTEIRPKKCRKRQINKSSWQCNIRKLNRNKGVEYVSKRGKIVAAKKFSPCAGHYCGKKGVQCQNVSIEDRKQIFKGFWNLANYNLQQAYICGCVSQRPATTHTVVRNQMPCQDVAPESASTEPPAGSQAVQNDKDHIETITLLTGNACSESVTGAIGSKSRSHRKRHYKNFMRTFSFNTSNGISGGLQRVIP